MKTIEWMKAFHWWKSQRVFKQTESTSPYYCPDIELQEYQLSLFLSTIFTFFPGTRGILSEKQKTVKFSFKSNPLYSLHIVTTSVWYICHQWKLIMGRCADLLIDDCNS
jgi:hypothetical protein